MVTIFSTVNMDIPIANNVGTLLLTSQEGVPNPWVTAPLAMLIGHLWVLDRRCIREGGRFLPTLSLVIPSLLPLWPRARTRGRMRP